MFGENDFMRVYFAFLSLLLLIISGLVQADEAVQDYRNLLSDYRIEIQDDLTYTRTVTLEYQVLTPAGAEEMQEYHYSYFSENESLKVLEASITHPDGKVFPVEKENIYEQDLGGRDKERRNREAVVIFSRLIPGSIMKLKFKHVVKKKSPMGFNMALQPELELEQKKIVATILLPENIPMKWGSRGEFAVKESRKGKRKELTVSLENFPYQEMEPNMVSSDDVLPMFALTSLKSWEEIGQIYYESSLNRQTDSDEIRALAEEITQGAKHPREEAVLIYNWVAQNINYLSLSFNLEDMLVPHPVEEILRHGYGDCKDQALLLQALLKARGVESKPALVSWDDSYKDWPVATSMQFNHVLLFIPELNTWLNPVSPLSTFGLLDYSLSGKRVVVAGPEGETRYLPAMQPDQNRYWVKNQSVLSSNGLLRGESMVTGTGIIGEQIRELLASSGSGEWKASNLLADTLSGGFGNISWGTPAYDLERQPAYQGDWHSPYAFQLGREGFITTAPGLDFQDVLALRTYLVDGKRKFPFTVGARHYRWDHRMKLPKNYKVTRLPENLEVRNGAGSYSSHYKMEGNTLVVTRQIVVKKNLYQPGEYPEFEKLAYLAINDRRAIIALKRR
ncbi:MULTISPECIES: DUF3857 domain-containing protein [unclassified Endozoicomonas]|uniref:DUF3857 domain-containing protein n=1 Tax=unclassified Endozoicomonas TaxID=2644528 RepID=UPI002149130A|nr:MULTISPECIES: DUF3857 domain-containing protein [unclassified Endozoicomonas]